MSGYLIAGVVIVITVFFTLCRIAPLRRWLGYATLVDIAFTVLMLSLFHDTFSGLMAACFAGLLMAMVLTILRRSIGYERLQMYRDGWRLRSRWVSHAADAVQPPKFIRVLRNMWRARHA